MLGDFEINEWTDLVTSQEGDICLVMVLRSMLLAVREVGCNGCGRSSALNAAFTDEKRRDKPLVMGCYGIVTPELLTAAVVNNTMTKGIKVCLCCSL